MNHMNGSILPMSTLLPIDVREALVQASKIESRVEFGESAERAAAVDAAVVLARMAHPTLFARKQ